MIKIVLNGNTIVEFEGTMDLRIGKEVKILGTKYCIKNVKSTREYVKVEVEEEQRCSITLDGKPFGVGMLHSGVMNPPVSRLDRNPFSR